MAIGSLVRLTVKAAAKQNRKSKQKKTLKEKELKDKK